jgi:hypothetical protein
MNFSWVSLLVSCIVYWSVDGRNFHKRLPGDLESFTIVDLLQGTQVSGIKMRCSNAEHEGQETDPPLSVRTHGTTPPRISSIGHFSTAAGEMSHEQAFTVGDEETHEASLQVWAISLNESIVPSRAIEIRGVGRDRTVRVEPMADVTGVAIIMVTVRDREGLTSSTTFEITIAPNWFYFFPTKGYAGSSTLITIHGAGFRQDSILYTCRLHSTDPSISSAAQAVSSSEIVCPVPAWPAAAQIITPELILNGFVVKQSELALALAKRISGTYKTQVRLSLFRSVGLCSSMKPVCCVCHLHCLNPLSESSIKSRQPSSSFSRAGSVRLLMMIPDW